MNILELSYDEIGYIFNHCDWKSIINFISSNKRFYDFVNKNDNIASIEWIKILISKYFPNPNIVPELMYSKNETYGKNNININLEESLEEKLQKLIENRENDTNLYKNGNYINYSVKYYSYNNILNIISNYENENNKLNKLDIIVKLSKKIKKFNKYIKDVNIAIPSMGMQLYKSSYNIINDYIVNENINITKISNMDLLFKLYGLMKNNNSIYKNIFLTANEIMKIYTLYSFENNHEDELYIRPDRLDDLSPVISNSFNNDDTISLFLTNLFKYNFNSNIFNYSYVLINNYNLSELHQLQILEYYKNQPEDIQRQYLPLIILALLNSKYTFRTLFNELFDKKHMNMRLNKMNHDYIDDIQHMCITLHDVGSLEYYYSYLDITECDILHNARNDLNVTSYVVKILKKLFNAKNQIVQDNEINNILPYSKINYDLQSYPFEEHFGGYAEY